jgi:hypothetical protein
LRKRLFQTVDSKNENKIQPSRGLVYKGVEVVHEAVASSALAWAGKYRVVLSRGHCLCELGVVTAVAVKTDCGGGRRGLVPEQYPPLYLIRAQEDVLLFEALLSSNHLLGLQAIVASEVVSGLELSRLGMIPVW